MKLTERQCWKVIRDLVASKNDEYKELLNVLFGRDIKKTKQIQGYTRDAFLRRYGIYSLNEFFRQYREATKSEPDTSHWLDNLNSECLLIFLDFRCRLLQKIYDYYTKYNNIDRNIVEQIIDGIKISPLSKFKINELNKIALVYSRKPERVAGGEKKLSQLNMDVDELNEQALAQTIGELVGGYIETQNVSADRAMGIAEKLVTQNIDHKGQKTGYRYRGQVEISLPKPEKTNIVKTMAEQCKSNTELLGFDKNHKRIFMRDGKYVNFLGDEIPPVKVVYDCNGNKIDETSHDDSFDSAAFVGFDIQGAPVYEFEGVYYNAIGQRLPDDVYIDTSSQEIEF